MLWLATLLPGWIVAGEVPVAEVVRTGGMQIIHALVHDLYLSTDMRALTILLTWAESLHR